MVIDTSAIVAILLGEPESEDFISRISIDPVKLMSAANVLETSIVIRARKGTEGLKELDNMIDAAKIDIVPFDKQQYKKASEAWWKYGKSRHQASLNFGDCFAYALAKDTQQPLLFKGNDFSKTDLSPA